MTRAAGRSSRRPAALVVQKRSGWTGSGTDAARQAFSAERVSLRTDAVGVTGQGRAVTIGSAAATCQGALIDGNDAFGRPIRPWDTDTAIAAIACDPRADAVVFPCVTGRRIVLLAGPVDAGGSDGTTDWLPGDTGARSVTSVSHCAGIAVGVAGRSTRLGSCDAPLCWITRRGQAGVVGGADEGIAADAVPTLAGIGLGADIAIVARQTLVGWSGLAIAARADALGAWPIQAAAIDRRRSTDAVGTDGELA